MELVSPARRILLAVVVGCVVNLPGQTEALAPPAWREYKVYSADLTAAFCAEVACAENCDLPYDQQTYRLTVRRSDTGAVEWSCPYDYRGHVGGILSNDGWVFVDVDPWYEDDEVPVVHVYRKGMKTFELTARYLDIVPPPLVAGGNPAYAWLRSYRFARDSDIPVLEIDTVDGRSMRINCLDGYMLDD